ncbi:MAG: hypothetical protein WA463_15570 [Terriglobales bacterium]
MPLARIITRTPQDAVGASEYLRSLGYTVETVSPEEFRVTPAELELNLDRCGAAEAVERALALVESGAAVAAKMETLPAPEPAPPQKAKVPIAYDITGQPVEFADQAEIESRPKDVGVRRALAAVATWLGRPWNDFRQRRAEQRALKLEAEAARQQEEVRRKDELAQERLRQEIRRQREAAEQQAQARVAALHQTKIAGEAAAAPEQPPPPETAPVVAAEAAGDNLTVLPVPAELAPERPQLPRRPQRPVHLRRRRAPIAISRAAVATACGLSLLLIMGFVAYANRRPASPFLPGVLTNVKQDVPFGAATITPSPVVSQRNPAGRRPAAMRLENRKPSAAQPGVRRSSRDNSQDEVVVRRLQPPQAKPQPQPSTAKLKRHSDLD